MRKTSGKGPRFFVTAVALFALLALQAQAQAFPGRKVLYIDSYHAGYEWSDGIYAGIEQGLKASQVELKVFRMDTKRDGSEANKKKSAAAAKALIDSWKPDVVITSDDNAAQYVIQAHYKNAKVPFVFNGLNWDCSVYGMPYTNTTGMLEVALVRELIGNMKEYAKGARIGYLCADTETERKEVAAYKDILKMNLDRVVYVRSVAEWMKEFEKLQGEVDMLIIGAVAGIPDWDYAEPTAFVQAKTRIPTGTSYDYLMPLSMIGITKVPEEQGLWSAQAALKILGGAAPSSIPVVQNKQGTLMLNIKVAARVGVVFKAAHMKNATILK